VGTIDCSVLDQQPSDRKPRSKSGWTKPGVNVRSSRAPSESGQSGFHPWPTKRNGTKHLITSTNLLQPTIVRQPTRGGPVMADETKSVTPLAGAKLYTGAGLFPFQSGEVAVVPAAHADDLAAQGAVEHIVPPEPAPPG
jgi:hypothetical protein